MEDMEEEEIEDDPAIEAGEANPISPRLSTLLGGLSTNCGKGDGSSELSEPFGAD